MDLSGTDRSAVRLGYGFALLLMLVPGIPAMASAEKPASRPFSLSTIDLIGQDHSIGSRELRELDPARVGIMLP